MIGVVGTCMSKEPFDEVWAEQALNDAFEKIVTLYPDVPIAVASGWTDSQVLAIAYRLARQRGWKTIGIACMKVYKYERFPVDEAIVDGSWLNWRDESPTFIAMCDAMVRVAGGSQSRDEAAEATRLGYFVLEYDYPVEG